MPSQNELQDEDAAIAELEAKLADLQGKIQQAAPAESATPAASPAPAEDPLAGLRGKSPLDMLLAGRPSAAWRGFGENINRMPETLSGVEQTARDALTAANPEGRGTWRGRFFDELKTPAASLLTLLPRMAHGVTDLVKRGSYALDNPTGPGQMLEKQPGQTDLDVFLSAGPRAVSAVGGAFLGPAISGGTQLGEKGPSRALMENPALLAEILMPYVMARGGVRAVSEALKPEALLRPGQVLEGAGVGLPPSPPLPPPSALPLQPTLRGRGPVRAGSLAEEQLSLDSPSGQYAPPPGFEMPPSTLKALNALDSLYQESLQRRRLASAPEAAAPPSSALDALYQENLQRQQAPAGPRYGPGWTAEKISAPAGPPPAPVAPRASPVEAIASKGKPQPVVETPEWEPPYEVGPGAAIAPDAGDFVDLRSPREGKPPFREAPAETSGGQETPQQRQQGEAELDQLRKRVSRVIEGKDRLINWLPDQPRRAPASPKPPKKVPHEWAKVHQRNRSKAKRPR